MSVNKNIISAKLFSKKTFNSNKDTLNLIKFYSKISDIINRTHVAMGKLPSYKTISSTTNNQKLKTHATTSTTHKNFTRLE